MFVQFRCSSNRHALRRNGLPSCGRARRSEFVFRDKSTRENRASDETVPTCEMRSEFMSSSELPSIACGSESYSDAAFWSSELITPSRSGAAAMCITRCCRIERVDFFRVYVSCHYSSFRRMASVSVTSAGSVTCLVLILIRLGLGVGKTGSPCPNFGHATPGLAPCEPIIRTDLQTVSAVWAHVIVVSYSVCVGVVCEALYTISVAFLYRQWWMSVGLFIELFTKSIVCVLVIT